MRKAVRAIVIHDNNLLVMRRDKFGKMYDTLPGGNIEVGESLEDAVRRELKEETSITIGDAKLVFIEDAGHPYGMQYIYLCEYESGEPRLSPKSEEALINKLGKNIHEPGWLSLADLPKTTFLSEQLKQKIVRGVEHGFPEPAESFTTR